MELGYSKYGRHGTNMYGHVKNIRQDKFCIN